MSSLALRSSRLRSALRLIFIFLITPVLAASLFAQSHARIVRLSYVDGDVQLDKADGRGFNPAYMNMPVTHQSKLWTGNGQAEVEFENGSSIRLTPGTIVIFTNLSSAADGRHDSTVELSQGTAYFDIRYQSQDSFHLEFGHEQIDLTRSAHFRAAVEKHQLDLAVFSGEVQVSNGPGTEVAVEKGETIRLDSDAPDTYDLAKGVDVENYDAWDKERAEWHDQTASTAATWNAPVDTSQVSTGSYVYLPTSGLLWSSGSAFGFGNGCWGYPGFSSPYYGGYPWGLSPYPSGYLDPAYGNSWCPASAYWNWNGPYVNTVYFVAPYYYQPMPLHPRHGPPVVAGREAPIEHPQHRFVIDGDYIAQHYHSTASAQTSSTVAVPRMGFTGISPTVSPVSPVHAVVSGTPTPVRPVEIPTVRPVTPAPMRAAPIPATAMSPRMSAPAMRPMGAPGMSRMSSPGMSGGMRMSAPSMSSGGMHMGGGMSGGGAAHSGGGSHHR